ncbi:hypothetical protein JHK82_035261 [Glycine max]|nr:hypothetical protein JHK87_035200 [Glycine soja]KAG4969566.1 hypothetical protein JHK85_035987 [Glycine max]KAG4975918.1 hypothetical protein JHK86_035392 [Glycine max]KAG5111992.1 hypothetical protein JHK82_035261 [Glycine max]KAG5129281.1 hypothetical protein JHK84_035678 [Glycine max]
MRMVRMEEGTSCQRCGTRRLRHARPSSEDWHVAMCCVMVVDIGRWERKH